MYNHIGKKIKGLAKVLFIVMVIAEFITGIVIICIDTDFISIALPVMLGGPVVSWILSWLLYGFGQLIDNSDKLVESLCKTESKRPETEPDRNAEYNTAANGKCELCGKEGVPVRDAKITDDLGTRYRRICSDCYTKHNASPK